MGSTSSLTGLQPVSHAIASSTVLMSPAHVVEQTADVGIGVGRRVSFRLVRGGVRQAGPAK